MRPRNGEWPLAALPANGGLAQTGRQKLMRIVYWLIIVAGLVVASGCAPTERGAPQASAKLDVARIPPSALPGKQADGSVLLPNQWSLRPVGRQIELRDFPVNVAVHPGGGFAAVQHRGPGFGPSHFARDPGAK